MKYFLRSVDENYVAPSPLGWQGILNKDLLRDSNASHMPKHMLFQLENHIQTVFTDIIVFPCFMVSETVMNVIKKYDPFVKFVRIVFFDKERKKSMTYNLPFLNQITCHREDKGNAGAAISIDGGQLKNGVIVKMENRDKTYVAVRIDLAESILRRNTVGIGLEEIKIY